VTSSIEKAAPDAAQSEKLAESFILRGDISGLSPKERALMYVRLCERLGLGRKKDFVRKDYEELASEYGVEEITGKEEKRLAQDYGRVVLLENFPEHTSPFWNMRRSSGIAHKIDVIIDGMETIGSAERSSDVKEMRRRFHTISEGGYAKLLYKKFGKARVERELEEFLSLKFFPRYGGGIGLTRLMKAIPAVRLSPIRIPEFVRVKR
jgi:aspartyl/asparaginyl-tRNA synthetase